jgi:hypothetical protein
MWAAITGRFITFLILVGRECGQRARAIIDQAQDKRVVFGTPRVQSPG